MGPDPVRKAPTADDQAVVAKTDALAASIDALLAGHPDSDPIAEMLRRLRTLRQSGLMAGGESSVENLTCKAPRALGSVEALADARRRATSADLSL